MLKPLGQFDIDETEDGYVLHVGDGSETHSFEISPDQMTAIIETFLDMIPEDEDELVDEEDEDAEAAPPQRHHS
jgi:hypothetical protein